MLCIIICEQRIVFNLGTSKFHFAVEFNLFISSTTHASIQKLDIVKGASKYNFSLVRTRDNVV